MPNGQGEGMWEWRRDRLWREAHMLKGLGQQFWLTVGLDPNMNPELLTEDDVERLAKELDFVKSYREKERVEREVIPQTWRDWISQYAVPEAGQEQFRGYPVTYNPNMPEAKGLYYHAPSKQQGRIELSNVEVSTLAHELAHVHYFEHLSPTAREKVTPILDWLEKTSPEFRRELYNFGGNPEKLSKWRKLPEERHAVLYQVFGKTPEKIPYYLDQYYHNLKPWQVGGDLGMRRWLLRQGQITPEQFYKHPWE